MAKATCNRCGKPIQWERNESDRWVPYNVRGDKIHWETCKGAPETDTPLQLKTRIEELETELRMVRAQCSGYRSQSQQYQLYVQQELAVGSQTRNVINTAKAWYRAYEKKSGRTEFHKKRVLKAVATLIEAEARQKAKPT